MIKWKISMLWFWTAYFVVTAIGIGHTCFNAIVLKMENVKPIETMYDIVAYAKTVPFHPLYNIIIWPIFAFLYFRMAKPENLKKTAFWLGLGWALITIIFDVFGWVLIRHPWAMTWKEMYLDYQPWITLIYLSIFISPYIGSILFNKLKK